MPIVPNWPAKFMLIYLEKWILLYAEASYIVFRKLENIKEIYFIYLDLVIDVNHIKSPPVCRCEKWEAEICGSSYYINSVVVMERIKRKIEA